MLPPPPTPGTPECPDDKKPPRLRMSDAGKTIPCLAGAARKPQLGHLSRRRNHLRARAGELGQNLGSMKDTSCPSPERPPEPMPASVFRRDAGRFDNLVPCFYTLKRSRHRATSSVIQGGKPTCVDEPAAAKPTSPWSPEHLTVDCVGHWKLCYTLRAGDGKIRSTDCVVATSCNRRRLPMPTNHQALPQLPAWQRRPPRRSTAPKVQSYRQLRRNERRRHHRHLRQSAEGIQPRKLLPAALQRQPDAAGMPKLRLGRIGWL